MSRGRKTITLHKSDVVFIAHAGVFDFGSFQETEQGRVAVFKKVGSGEEVKLPEGQLQYKCYELDDFNDRLCTSILRSRRNKPDQVNDDRVESVLSKSDSEKWARLLSDVSHLLANGSQSEKWQAVQNQLIEWLAAMWCVHCEVDVGVQARRIRDWLPDEVVGTSGVKSQAPAVSTGASQPTPSAPVALVDEPKPSPPPSEPTAVTPPRAKPVSTTVDDVGSPVCSDHEVELKRMRQDLTKKELRIKELEQALEESQVREERLRRELDEVSRQAPAELHIAAPEEPTTRPINPEDVPALRGTSARRGRRGYWYFS